jgi:hypothetical protein
VCNSIKKGEFCKVFGLLHIHLVKKNQDKMTCHFLSVVIRVCGCRKKDRFIYGSDACDDR